MRLPIKKERIFRVIIERECFDFKFLKEETNLSKSFISRTLHELMEKNLLIEEFKNYRVIDRVALLKHWALEKRKIFNSLKFLKLFFFVKTRVREIFKDYVLSGPFAEYLVNGQTQGEEMIIYTTSIDEKEILNYLSKKPNAFLFVYDEHIFYNHWKLKGWKLVSIPQLCADLLAHGIYADVALDLFKRWVNVHRA
jgi:hypothetical protein